MNAGVYVRFKLYQLASFVRRKDDELMRDFRSLRLVFQSLYIISLFYLLTRDFMFAAISLASALAVHAKFDYDRGNHTAWNRERIRRELDGREGQS